MTLTVKRTPNTEELEASVRIPALPLRQKIPNDKIGLKITHAKECCAV